ncbi:MAG: NADH-quinone oxidoreductase subunit L [Azospirillum sp.]|nr:NADH-quinone oxidoreductase subunit L [Azospirillum sp.]
METSLILAPFLGSLISFALRTLYGSSRGPLLATASIGYATGAAVLLFLDPTIGQGRDIAVLDWMSSGSFHALWSVLIDPPSVLMLFVVTVVSAAVHVYSLGYMQDDPRRDVFFGNISLFTGFMILLVTADNLVQLYFGWEGVGLASYLLINHWYERASANDAAIKSFIVNRIGDFAFLIGLLAVFMVFGSVDFADIFAKVPAVAGTTLHIIGFDVDCLTLICLLLFVGAMGKSAQLGLHVWLPDAMEAPTPVSALIHAATMVTAGVFMVVRLAPLFQAAPLALDVITVIGATTAFMAATIALTVFDIKRIVAYSTMSQLGYMFVACGAGAFHAAMFHLFTHAFFKALLFLGAGVVIHALSGEQDIRRMGGLGRVLPFTFGAMIIGSLALSGMPGFSGFYSKEAILAAVWASDRPVAGFAFALCAATVALTAFYAWRLIFAVFHGTARGGSTHGEGAETGDGRQGGHDAGHHATPGTMVATLALLAVAVVVSALSGLALLPEGGHAGFWGTALAGNAPAPALPPAIQGGLIAAVFAGIALAYACYVRWPLLPAWIAARFRPLDRLFRNKWFFDAVYHRYFVEASYRAGRRLARTVDGSWIDDFGVKKIVGITKNAAGRVAGLQSGLIYDYAFAMVAGITVVVSWFLFNS